MLYSFFLFLLDLLGHINSGDFCQCLKNIFWLFLNHTVFNKYYKIANFLHGHYSHAKQTLQLALHLVRGRNGQWETWDMESEVIDWTQSPPLSMKWFLLAPLYFWMVKKVTVKKKNKGEGGEKKKRSSVECSMYTQKEVALCSRNS